MITEFDRFCLAHACAPWQRGNSNFCPLADEIQQKHGTVKDCKRLWEERQKKSEAKDREEP